MTLSHKDKPTVMGEAVSQRARDAFYAESIDSEELLPGTQVVAIDSFLRALDRVSTNIANYQEASDDLQFAEASYPFAREDRYIVIKRNKLTPLQGAALRDWLIPTVDAVVVEADWPEYEPVWKMIQDRVAGVSTNKDETIAKLVEALSGVRDWLRSAPLESGYCCCGSSVESHGMGDGHSPVDELTYSANGQIELIDAALTSTKKEG